MAWVALKMLTGDFGKYIAIICGVAFASLLITQQSAAFCGVLLRTTSQIREIRGIDIWGMNPNVRYVDDVKAISDNAFLRVRSVPGIAWTANLYRGAAQAQLENGNYQGSILLGIDDSTLVGAPTQMLLGKLGDLQIPDSVLVPASGGGPGRQTWR